MASDLIHWQSQLGAFSLWGFKVTCQTSTPVRRSQITHLSIHPTPVSTSRDTHPSQIQNKVVFSPDIQPRHSTDTFTRAQRRQSTQMFHSSGNIERSRNEEFVMAEEPPSGSPPSSDGESS